MLDCVARGVCLLLLYITAVRVLRVSKSKAHNNDNNREADPTRGARRGRPCARHYNCSDCSRRRRLYLASWLAIYAIYIYDPRVPRARASESHTRTHRATPTTPARLSYLSLHGFSVVISVCVRCSFVGCCSRRVRGCVSLSGVLFFVGLCVSVFVTC